ncbi:polysaccharide biosynthesis/export family protein [Puniceicoccaceae bacterium K14]|nr:polysaccharide biosynthesis/export family protein [Puniceicoccaceae bacterium K14]
MNNRNFLNSNSMLSLSWAKIVFLLANGIALLMFSGCGSSSTQEAAQTTSPTGMESTDSLTLFEGDVLRITFPGAPELNEQQTIRRDGRITLSLVGEVEAVGLTPVELEEKLLGLYSSELVSNEVMVTVTSSQYPIFVTGAVVRPGKIMADRRITALESVMEAGGFDFGTANMTAVVVSRVKNGESKNFTLNLKKVLEGRTTEVFFLEPGDRVYVPQKVVWF